jgi:cell division protein FtsQ
MSKRRSDRYRGIRRFLTFLAALFAVCTLIYLLFPLRQVVTTGNIHESADEVTALLMSRPVCGNVLLAKLLNTNRTIKNGGFIESIDAQITGRTSLRVTVTEKRMVGYVTDKNGCWYFDSQGLVGAMQKKPTEGDGISPVEGLKLLSDPAVGSLLPTAGSKAFVILDTLRSMSDLYQIPPDKIIFHEDGTFSIDYGKVEVLMGDGTNLDGRMRELKGILNAMDDSYAGTLHLEDFTGTEDHVIFDKS